MVRTKRPLDTLRPITIKPNYNPHAEGSVLYCCGKTQVLCTVSITDGVPRFLKDSRQGWLTAEYGLLPRATHSRCDREASKGRPTGRTIEIQRLIGRSLRSCVNLFKLANKTIMIDCDVLVADGGTRTASINGACAALLLALQELQYKKIIKHDPLLFLVGAVSVGVKGDKLYLDIDYQEDARLDTDLNLVMNGHGEIIEIQGTAEGNPLPIPLLMQAIELGKQGIHTILEEIKSQTHQTLV